MKNKVNNNMTIYIITMLILTIILFWEQDLHASSKEDAWNIDTIKVIKKNRTNARIYNKKSTRKQAIQMIRSNSEQLCKLAGINPMPGDSLNNNISEIREDDDMVEYKVENEVPADIENFKMFWLDYVEGDTENVFASCGIPKTVIMDNIMAFLGSPYKFGGNTSDGIDCSAFVQKIFRKSANILLPRTASEQSKIGKKITRKNLKFGDMLFFNTRKKVYVSHVGIYLGDSLFAHASSRYGVTVSTLDSAYYNKRLITAVRLQPSDFVEEK